MKRAYTQIQFTPIKHEILSPPSNCQRMPPFNINRNQPPIRRNGSGEDAGFLVDHPARLLITGRSTSGKSTFAVGFICRRMLRQVRRCYAICPTFYSQSTLGGLRKVQGAFQRKDVFTAPSNDAFEYIFKQQRRFPYPALLFIDDVADSACTNVGSKGAFAKLCIQAPHINLTIVAIFQGLTQCSKAMRLNTEGLIAFMPDSEDEVNQIIKEFNPWGFRLGGKKLLRAKLEETWQTERFAFFWKTKFHPLTNPLPRTRLFAGMSREIF